MKEPITGRHVQVDEPGEARASNAKRPKDGSEPPEDEQTKRRHQALAAALLSVHCNAHVASSGAQLPQDAKALLDRLPSMADAVKTIRDTHARNHMTHAGIALARAYLDGVTHRKAHGSKSALSTGTAAPTGLRTLLDHIETLFAGARAEVGSLVGSLAEPVVGDTDGALAVTAVGRALMGDETFHYEVLCDEVDADGVSRFRARVLRENGRDFKQYVTYSDPQNWKKNVPQTFNNSFATKISRGLGSVDEDPKEDHDFQSAEVIQQEGWAGYLFEDAGFPRRDADITTFRNILKINFNVRPRQERINLDYRLYSSLSSQVLDHKVAGGINVDYGDGQVKLQGNTANLVAGKNLRFAANAPLSAGLNFMALPFLRYWISALILAEI
jgi:hypothetical protein